ncbi:MAG: hypothetical protein IT422_27335 [Pirellulaceae bacterium]|nr:hypothetical protein [Pirellulaceae bacterium]
MKHISTYLTLAVIFVGALSSDALAQRGRGGGGGRGFSGGGHSYSGGGHSYSGGGMSARPSSGFTSPARTVSPSTYSAGHSPSTLPSHRTSGIGPNGGSWQAGSGGGGHTTQGGATVEWKGAGFGGTTAGGVSGGRGVGGVSITTAGGQEFNRVGRAGAATGPGGNTVGRGGSVSRTSGPQGSGVSASRSGFASGPNGMAAYRGGVAIGPNGAVAGRTGIAATPHGTYYRSAAAVRGQGAYVRAGCAGYGCFSRAWYQQYPATWMPGRWAAATVWTAATWSALASTGSYPAEPTSYDYGSTVVYQDDSVYIDGENVGTAEKYSEQASAIAETGATAQASPEDEWLPLGVFAMVQGDEKSSNNIFQLATNKAGVIRGNYYNAVTDTTEPVVGSIDRETQRAAWTVGDAKKPVYEAGLVNLTKEETTMMIHYSSERSQQATLFRMEQPEDQAANP